MCNLDPTAPFVQGLRAQRRQPPEVLGTKRPGELETERPWDPQSAWRCWGQTTGWWERRTERLGELGGCRVEAARGRVGSQPGDPTTLSKCRPGESGALTEAVWSIADWEIA